MFYFSFILEFSFLKRKKKKKDYTTQKEGKGEGGRRKKIKRKLIKIAIGILHTSHTLSSIICRPCIYIL